MTSPKKTYLPSYLPSYLQHLPIYLPQTTPLRNGPRDLWPLRHLIRTFWAQICSLQRLPSYRIFQAFTNLLNLSKIKWFFCFQCTFLHTTEIICSEQTEFDFVSLPIFTGWHCCIYRVTFLYFPCDTVVFCIIGSVFTEWQLKWRNCPARVSSFRRR